MEFVGSIGYVGKVGKVALIEGIFGINTEAGCKSVFYFEAAGGHVFEDFIEMLLLKG